MSDFRIPITPYIKNSEYDRELEWDEDGSKWTVSEREKGVGPRWIQNIKPHNDDLANLFDFFRIKPGTIPIDVWARLSPGELTLVHHNSVDSVSVYAVLCSQCGRHWYIFRWEEDESRWAIYGRMCDFSWKRGEELSENEVTMLKRAQRNSTNYLHPPK